MMMEVGRPAGRHLDMEGRLVVRMVVGVVAREKGREKKLGKDSSEGRTIGPLMMRMQADYLVLVLLRCLADFAPLEQQGSLNW